MSESIKLIYKILKILEQSMDYPEFDVNRLKFSEGIISDPLKANMLKCHMVKKRGMK